jgi:hypothetical protein
MKQPVTTAPRGEGDQKAGARSMPAIRWACQPSGIGPAATSVRRDTGEQAQNDEQDSEITGGFTPQERAAIDKANAAFAPVIDAADMLDETIENIETWAEPLVRGVRALRDRAMRETGAPNYSDPEYRKKFGVLLRTEPIGPWLLARHAELDAVHYLGSDDGLPDKFMKWRRTQITDEQRKKWRSLRTLVDHFKQWQSGTGTSKDRRTSDQKEIEQVRTEGHKADAARLAEVEQVRQELATGVIKTTETLWTALRQAGPELLVQALKEHDAKEYGRTAYELMGPWLNEPSA